MVLFVLIGGDLFSLPLPPGREWVVGLGVPPMGRHAVKVLHRLTDVPPAWEPFVVGESPASPPCARLAVSLRGQDVLPGNDAIFRLDGDFTPLEAGPDGLEVIAPPCWVVRPLWDDGRRLRVKPAFAELDGVVDLAATLARTAEVRRRALEGDLVLDAAELGRVVLRHTRARDPERVLPRVRQLVTTWGGQLEALGSNFPMLRLNWLSPLLESLGYECRDLNPTALGEIFPGATVAMLDTSMRGDGRVIQRPAAVLVHTASALDLGSTNLTLIREFAERLCVRLEVEKAIVTAGLRWVRHRRGYATTLRVWDLGELTAPGAEARFTDFYETFGG